MAANGGTSAIIRRGYMTLVKNPKTGVVHSITSSILSRKYWTILRKDAAGCLLELYRSEELMTQNTPIKTLTLSPTSRIETIGNKKAFVLNNDTGADAMMFVCQSRADMEDWARDIKRYAEIPEMTSTSSTANGVTPESQLYEAIPDDEIYHVTLRQSNTVVFNGACCMEILKDFERNVYNIALYTEQQPPRLIVKWQIDHIRQYGSNDMAFKFQSGRKSSTGVDWFILDSKPGDATRIHRAVEYWARHIVQETRNRGTSDPTSRVSRKRSHVKQVEPPRPHASHVPPPGTHYAPLTGETMEPTSHYELVDQNRRSASAAGSLPSASQYQALNKVKTTPTQPDNTYQDLEMASREMPPVIPPRTPIAGAANSLSPQHTQQQQQQQYMELNRTKDVAEPVTYMGLK